MLLRTLCALSLLVLLFVAGCGSNPEESAQSYDKDMASGADARVVAPMSEPAALMASSDMVRGQAAPTSAPQQRMIIKTANLNLEVPDYAAAQADVQRIATAAGGYMASSNVYEMEANRKSGNVVIRIPTAKFDETIAAIKAIAKTVQSESISGNDITEEFYDLTARLENKKRAETRFLEILRSAKNAKEILEVERGLMEIREEIERMEGRKRFLTDQTDLSTISVSMVEPAPVLTTHPNKFWSRLTHALGSGFERGMDGVVSTASAAMAFIIMVLPPVVVVWVLYKVMRRVRRKREEQGEE